LIVAHDTTHLDMRIVWLELCNFKKRYVYMGGDSTMSFKSMEALDLYIRGHSNKVGAEILRITLAAYKKRLKKAREAFEVESMEALRVKASRTGFIHLLMVPHMPPYDPDLTLADILRTIDDS